MMRKYCWVPEWVEQKCSELKLINPTPDPVKHGYWNGQQSDGKWVLLTPPTIND